MNTHLLAALSLVSFASVTLPSSAQEMEERDLIVPIVEAKATEMFRCNPSANPPSTIVTEMASAENGEPLPLIHWSAQYFQSENEALSLCEKVSQQLQALYEAGELMNLSLVSGEMNGEAVVCLEKDVGAGCDRVLFTLDTNRNPKVVLYELIAAEFKPPRTRGDFPTRLDFSFLDWFYNSQN
ncbi:MAG: COP23 domain-containing protein [Halothece sp. Uz-M2-17]|nr:COP23 domain-containing protein [Halothece sp. Uz-M2-17]